MNRTGARKIVSTCALLVIVLCLYSYPSFKARAELGSHFLPPIIAPDLTLYLNLSNLMPVGDGEVLNPYYRIPVPRNGAGYLKFSLAPRLFGRFDQMLGSRTWTALLMWNAFWWACLCIAALNVFEHYLPPESKILAIPGVLLLMLFNFAVLKTNTLAWVHLPSVAAFDSLGLPFSRAFVPVIPCVLILAYLGAQIEALRKQRICMWFLMAMLQLLAVAIFPYATLLMAGITAVSIVAQPIRPTIRKTWVIPAIYAVICGLLDCSFLLRGTVGFYENRSPAIHFQPQLLPHLVGGNWLLMLGLTIGIALAKALPREVRWPLVGLGASNVLLMLGDAIIPAARILLSHHAGHFVHTTTATLATFLAAIVFGSWLNDRSWKSRSVVALFSLFILINGSLLVSGSYRGFLGINLDVAHLSSLGRSLNLTNRDLIIAPSKDVDDACGWLPLISTSPVMFCTDSEVMLSPQQNRNIQHFRQALYLYFTGEDSDLLERELSVSDPSSLMYRLGYWAEAATSSPEERKDGIRQIQSDLIPELHKVEKRDAAVGAFFRDYTRIIVVDKNRVHSFDSNRLDSFLEFETRQGFQDLTVSFYRPK
jgi:hypothetical protein